MLARVLTKRDEPRLALTSTMFAVLALAGVVVDDIWRTDLFRPPGFPQYLGVALMIALAGIGPWLAWSKRGSVARLACEPGQVKAGRVVVNAADVTALRVASGAHGKSVAIARGKRVTFVEVEDAPAAARIAKALGVPAAFGDLTLAKPSRWLAVFQALVTCLALTFAPLYFLSAVVAPVLQEGKAIFGVGGVFLSFVSLVVLLVRAFGRGVSPGTTRWDAHAALHAREASEAFEVTRDSVAPKPAGRLGRGEEPTAAWLARLDALPAETHAYRGGALPADSLWQALRDDAAPVDTRMAAARVLRLRFGEEPRALVRVVDDGDIRARIEVALEEHDDAEEHLERLGPLFRAQ